MRSIQTPRIYGHETGTRYALDLDVQSAAVNSLAACFLLAKEKELTFESLCITCRDNSETIKLNSLDFGEYVMIENFINQYASTIASWHLQMKRNNYPISFGSCCNNEIGCTYHHWCLIDVEALIESIESRITKGWY